MRMLSPRRAEYLTSSLAITGFLTKVDAVIWGVPTRTDWQARRHSTGSLGRRGALGRRGHAKGPLPTGKARILTYRVMRPACMIQSVA
jgi:hypothetical protein